MTPVGRYSWQANLTASGCRFGAVIGNVSFRRQSGPLRAYLGRFSMARLSRRHLAEYRDQRLEVVSPMTVIHELNLLHRILVVATTEWDIPLPGGIPRVRLPKKPEGRVRRVSDDEQQRLVDELAHLPELKHIVLFALETGMRRSEICKMEWKDIDLSRSTLLIPETKTGVSREIPLSKRALELLNAQRHEANRVFDIKPATASQGFARACVRAEVEDRRFHDLRL